MNTNGLTKKYYLTASPDCYTLDIHAAFLYDVLTQNTDQFDTLYVNFGHTNCYLTSPEFGNYFGKWSRLLEGKRRPEMYMTLSATSQRNFVAPEDVQQVLKVSFDKHDINLIANRNLSIGIRIETLNLWSQFAMYDKYVNITFIIILR